MVREIDEIVEVMIQMDVVIKTKVVTEVDEIVEEGAMADMKMMMEMISVLMLTLAT